MISDDRGRDQAQLGSCRRTVLETVVPNSCLGKKIAINSLVSKAFRTPKLTYAT